MCDLLDTVNIYWFWHTNYETATHQRQMGRRIFTINTNDQAVILAVVQTVLYTSTSCVCLFPIYRARALFQHQMFFFQHTHRTGLELQTTLLNVVINMFAYLCLSHVYFSSNQIPMVLWGAPMSSSCSMASPPPATTGTRYPLHVLSS